jgi:hypothetical protein
MPEEHTVRLPTATFEIWCSRAWGAHSWLLVVRKQRLERQCCRVAFARRGLAAGHRSEKQRDRRGRREVEAARCSLRYRLFFLGMLDLIPQSTGAESDWARQDEADRSPIRPATGQDYDTTQTGILWLHATYAAVSHKYSVMYSVVQEKRDP